MPGQIDAQFERLPKLVIGAMGFGGRMSGAIADGWINARRPGSRSPASTSSPDLLAPIVEQEVPDRADFSSAGLDRATLKTAHREQHGLIAPVLASRRRAPFGRCPVSHLAVGSAATSQWRPWRPSPGARGLGGCAGVAYSAAASWRSPTWDRRRSRPPSRPSSADALVASTAAFAGPSERQRNCRLQKARVRISEGSGRGGGRGRVGAVADRELQIILGDRAGAGSSSSTGGAATLTR